ncbi:28S ribosomal protein S23, mitochondrial [Bulinus truncatus]|nr:28S ribosomal protein S23, mitochondrial [Bulinus truncatus]
MAGSRRVKLGSIMTRLSGLMQSGAIKIEDRPIWYDIVKVVPPKPVPAQKQIQNIFYPEDYVRVHFYQTFAQEQPIVMGDNRKKSISQRFIEKYLELHRAHVEPSANLFDETVAALKSEGIHLRTHQEKAAHDVRFKKADPNKSPFEPKVDTSQSQTEVDTSQSQTKVNTSKSQIKQKQEAVNLDSLFNDSS